MMKNDEAVGGSRCKVPPLCPSSSLVVVEKMEKFLDVLIGDYLG